MKKKIDYRRKAQIKMKIIDEDFYRDILLDILEDRREHDANWVKDPKSKKKKVTKVVVTPELTTEKE